MYLCKSDTFEPRCQEKRPMHASPPARDGHDPDQAGPSDRVRPTQPEAGTFRAIASIRRGDGHHAGPSVFRGGLIAALLAFSLAAPPSAQAAPPLLVQGQPGEALGAAVLALDGMPPGQISPQAGAMACTEQPRAMPRLAVVTGQPRMLELKACQQSAGAEVLAVTIGYQAIVLVAPARAPAFAMRSADLFRAVTGHGRDGVAPAVWRDVNPALPDLPIGLLAPPAGSTASRLFRTYVMEPACGQVAGGSRPFELTTRIDYCAALRAAPGIAQRRGDTSAVLGWAASAPPGQFGVVSLAELRDIGADVVALPLDDVLPTAANVGAGLYPAAESVVLLIVLPPDSPQAARAAARQAAFELLSERAIGPGGSLAHAGLIPLPPNERVEARSRALSFVEHP